MLKGSLIVLFGSSLANLGTYLFHLAMGRLLGPADYGILASLISLSYYLGIPINVLTLMVVKFVSQNNKDKKKISLFLQKISRKIIPFGLAVSIIFLFSFPLLRRLVKVDSFILFLGLGISSFLSIYITIISATLQGIMKFLKLGLVNILGSWSKLIIAALAVLLGTKVVGVVYGSVFSSLVCLAAGYWLVKRYIPLNLRGEISIKSSFGNLRSYSLAILFSNLALTSFFTADIILARYYLPPTAAGQYASLSVLGKIIFFASSSVANVMFPMVSERQANGGNYHKLLGGSFLLVLSISAFVSLIYFVFPKQMVSVLFGPKYLEAACFLSLFAIFISLYSLCSLLMNFYLSISKTKIIYLGVIFALIQVVLINFFHRSIQQIVEMNILTLSLLLLGLIIYYLILQEYPAYGGDELKKKRHPC